MIIEAQRYNFYSKIARFQKNKARGDRLQKINEKL
jgi:hypothetical protein